MASPAARAIALETVVSCGPLLVRDRGLPFVAVNLLLALKLGFDADVWFLEARRSLTAAFTRT